MLFLQTQLVNGILIVRILRLILVTVYWRFNPHTVECPIECLQLWFRYTAMEIVLPYIWLWVKLFIQVVKYILHSSLYDENRTLCIGFLWSSQFPPQRLICWVSLGRRCERLIGTQICSKRLLISESLLKQNQQFIPILRLSGSVQLLSLHPNGTTAITTGDDPGSGVFLLLFFWAFRLPDYLLNHF